MVKFVDKLYIADSQKSKISRIKWKTICGIGMVNVHFITLSECESDVFDIYSASTFKQRAFRKSKLIILGVAGGYDEATQLAGSMIAEAIESTGDIKGVRAYFDNYVLAHI